MGATLIVQPLDLVKNRMQLSGEFYKIEIMFRSNIHSLLNFVLNFQEREVVKSFTKTACMQLHQSSKMKASLEFTLGNMQFMIKVSFYSVKI